MRRSSVLSAVVVGTALSAIGADCRASQPQVEATQKAIVDMGRYCTSCWRNARLPTDTWSDCTQEVFSRMLERVPPSTWTHVLRDEGEERREFLRAIDTVKKRTQRARRYAPALDSVADHREPATRSLDEDREAVHRAASEHLSPRQQRILQMSFDGWAAVDISRELDMPVERVSDEKYKAIRKLRTTLAVG
jgi:RNA polymerase sigma factor (sigma-70 family)